MSKKSMIKALHLLRQLIEIFQEKSRVLYITFINLENKPTVGREILGLALMKESSIKCIYIIKEIYDELVVNVKNYSSLIIFYYSWITLRIYVTPSLFATVMDRLTTANQAEKHL